MKWHKGSLELGTRGKGLYACTTLVNAQLQAWQVGEGLCFLFCPHTSASLTINENYDPSARADLATALEKLVPEQAHWYTHTSEGADDASSHIRSLLTDTQLTLPVDNGRLTLGTWQGLFLVEHRSASQRRQLWLRVLEMER